MLQRVSFSDPARAELNLALIERRLPQRLWHALPALLVPLPDPDGAINYLERYLRPDAGERLAHALHYLVRNPGGLYSILVVFSFSRFLSETLIQQPDLVTWFHRPSGARRSSGGLEQLKPQEDLDEEFARFEATSLDTEPSVVLARFKRREYLRIMLRDVLGLATLADTTLELSTLADVLLYRALRTAEQALEKSYGGPQHPGVAGRLFPSRFVLFSLGKLGAQELNYSSDVDLMFFYTGDGATSGGTAGAISNAEFFTRLAQRILKLVAEVTMEGAVFRVDLRLRPQGTEGDLVMSIPAALDYYRNRAREWELQMLIKARPSAGDIEAGRRFLQELHPLIFRRDFDWAVVEAVLNAREEISRGLSMADVAPPGTDSLPAVNVKLSPGGIRDIEFLAQCLQRLYGGTEPWLSGSAASSTLVALQRLHDKGHLTQQDFFRLASAYQFLRRVEHRLQLRDGLQRHTLPDAQSSAPGALDRLARRCGIEPSAGSPAGTLLCERIQRHLEEVRQIYERILPRTRAGSAPSQSDLVADHEGTALQQRLRREFPAVYQAFAEAIAKGDATARRGVGRFLSAALLEPKVMARLAAAPGRVSDIAALASRSDLAADFFSRHPTEMDVLGDPARSFSLPDVSTKDVSAGMAALRLAYRTAVLATIVQALRGELRPFATFERLTLLADHVLSQAFRLAALPLEHTASAPFTVLALGRLGTREMDFASDADLVFVADESLSSEQREEWRRCAERFVQVVSSHTRDGLLFPIDTRLRPQGKQGEMVQSLAYLRDYLGREAQAWETATYLKARPVAGNLDLGSRAVRELCAVIADRWFAPGGSHILSEQLSGLRQRMETEGTGPRARSEFKHLPGSLYDIEYILAFSFLLENRAAFTEDGRPVAGGNLLEQIETLERLSGIPHDRAVTLKDAAVLYRSFDHAHRLITGRPVNHYPEPSLAERVHDLLRIWETPLVGPEPASLDEVLASTRAAVRGIYSGMLLAAET